MQHEETAPVLSAKRRERTGSRYCARVRQAGGLPAIVYGHGEAPVSIALDGTDTINHLTKGEKVFKLQLDDESDTQVVIIKALQFGHLGNNIVHADFARVDFDERIEVRVTVHLVGEAVGLAEAGAILMHPTNELEIECRVANLPSTIEVDVSELEAGSILHAGEITLPLPTMKLVTDPKAIVAQIVVQAQVEEEPEEAAEVTGDAEPEVLTEKKEEEEGGA
jgi:large subunit ribosomal protein L25